MADSRHIESQKFKTETAALTDLNKKLKKAMEEMNASLKDYKTEYFISPKSAPENVATIESVLERFLAHHNISNLDDLVSRHENLLSKAIEHTRNPSDHDNRADYRNTLRDLNTILKNKVEYNKLNSPAKESGNFQVTPDKYNNLVAVLDENGNKVPVMGPQPLDGFSKYVALAQKISNFVNAYNKIVAYTKGTRLDFDNLPQAGAIQNSLLAIAAPTEKSANQANRIIDNSVGADKESDVADQNNNGDTANANNYMIVGDEKFLAIMNKNVFDQVTTVVTAEKYKCLQDAMKILLEHNTCVIDPSQNGEDLDLKCQKLQEQADIAKANCNSHYPMVTITDRTIKDAFEKAEKIGAVTDINGFMQLDYKDINDALNDFASAGQYIKQNATLPMLGAPVFDYNITSLDVTIPTSQMLLGASSNATASECDGE